MDMNVRNNYDRKWVICISISGVKIAASNCVGLVAAQFWWYSQAPYTAPKREICTGEERGILLLLRRQREMNVAFNALIIIKLRFLGSCDGQACHRAGP